MQLPPEPPSQGNHAASWGTMWWGRVWWGRLSACAGHSAPPLCPKGQAEAGPQAEGLRHHTPTQPTSRWLCLLAASVLCGQCSAQSLSSILAPLNLDPTQAIYVVGDSPEAKAYGFLPTAKSVTVRSLTETRTPKLQIIWKEALEVPVFEMPSGAKVFTRDHWTGAPLAAGLPGFSASKGKPVLWTAVAPGTRGFERFPYLPQALAELGLKPRFESRALWTFFDSSYRLRADPNYLAQRWRRGGVSALQLAAWHFWERDPARDAWLEALIAACHNYGILVYAWVEFPHVSEAFWDKHLEWREKTASGQDAQLDWRKLMNLADPDCAQTVAAGLDALTRRFDWDGLNLGELYFESLEGHENPSRFTPFNALVRSSFRAQEGFDPLELYDRKSDRCYAKDATFLRKFLTFRASLAARLQEEWLGRLTQLKKTKPHLDLVLTHVDDRFDASMRDKLGADAPRLLAATQERGVTFLVEDPATIWHLGPERYAEIAKRYAPLTKRPDLLAIDLNIVERYQDVYPVKQQTGTELFQLVRSAADSFHRVALYFENSILPVDWPLLAASAAPVRKAEWAGANLQLDLPQSLSVEWKGCALLDGREWPVQDGERVFVPAGKHKLSPCKQLPARCLTDFNGDLLDARIVNGKIRVKYESRSRAIALVSDGKGGAVARMLPAGKQDIAIPE